MILLPAAEQKLKSFLNNEFVIKFSEKYGSHNPDHRKNIREDILKNYTSRFMSSQREKFLDLKQRPEIPGAFLSISHTADVGAWIVGPRPVGIDIEQTARLTERLIRRVCRQSEILSAQENVETWKILWAAKESAYKALSHVSDIRVMSEIEILWPQKGDLNHGENFYLSHNQTNKKISCTGFAYLLDFHALSVTVLNH